jgi:hypothetical protein
VVATGDSDLLVYEDINTVIIPVGKSRELTVFQKKRCPCQVRSRFQVSAAISRNSHQERLLSRDPTLRNHEEPRIG